MMSSLRFALAIAALPACGSSGSPLDPGGGDDPGGGTNTLVVDGTVTADAIITNATDPTDFTTELVVRVRRADQDVKTGEVTVTSNGGKVSLVFEETMNRWRGVQAGYFEVYALDVTSGEDAVTGVRVDGPDIHVLTAPLPGGSVDSEQALEVTWSRDEMAEMATMRTRDTDRIAIPDTGTHSLPMGTLRSKPDEVEDEEIELVRSQQIAPTGAVAGSSFRVSVTSKLDIRVLATN